MPPPALPHRRHWLALAGALALPGGAQALAAPPQGLAVPRGKVVLSVTGKLSRPNVGRQADFDMDMLAALPQTRFATHTPWDPQRRQFTGPLLRDVLAQAGAQGTMLQAIALNAYRVDIPMEDTRRFDVIVARLLDDQPMRVRDRGPLFIIYPFDALPELQAQRYYSRAAWQLRQLDVS